MMDIDICDQLKFCVIKSVHFGNRNGNSFCNGNYANCNYAISYNIFIGISY